LAIKPLKFAVTKICLMLSEKEEAFLAWWKQHRNRQKKLFYQLLVGLPSGLLIGLLIIANFFSGWYKRADMIANSQFNPMVLYLAAGLIAIFFAVFSKKFQWDQQEQRYLELLAKKKKINDATKTQTDQVETNEKAE
jgi:uncharacterized membrane protein